MFLLDASMNNAPYCFMCFSYMINYMICTILQLNVLFWEIYRIIIKIFREGDIDWMFIASQIHTLKL